MKYCTNCGSEVKETDAFCVSCGSPLSKTIYNGTKESSADSPFGFSEQPQNTVNECYTYNSNQSQNNIKVPKTNTLCLVGFILSFIFSFIGLILSCLGLSQVKKNKNEKGRELSIAGIVISSIRLIFIFLIILIPNIIPILVNA